jgi:hypothetical protein
MCFYSGDYDWYAAINEESTLCAAKPTQCDECHTTIPIGGIVHHIFQQENESCSDCEDGYCTCPRDEDGDCLDCCCLDPNYGESFECDWCDECDKFVKAVKAAEIEAGCPEHQSRPLLTQMRDSIHDGGMEEAKKYWIKARSLYPELVASGYLGKLWRRVF